MTLGSRYVVGETVLFSSFEPESVANKSAVFIDLSVICFITREDVRVTFCIGYTLFSFLIYHSFSDVELEPNMTAFILSAIM